MSKNTVKKIMEKSVALQALIKDQTPFQINLRNF